MWLICVFLLSLSCSYTCRRVYLQQAVFMITSFQSGYGFLNNSMNQWLQRQTYVDTHFTSLVLSINQLVKIFETINGEHWTKP